MAGGCRWCCPTENKTPQTGACGAFGGVFPRPKHKGKALSTESLLEGATATIASHESRANRDILRPRNTRSKAIASLESRSMLAICVGTEDAGEYLAGMIGVLRIREAVQRLDHLQAEAGDELPVLRTGVAKETNDAGKRRPQFVLIQLRHRRAVLCDGSGHEVI